MENRLRNILIYGFGRMGLTHFAILNSLELDFNFTVLDTNKKMVAILRKNFPEVTFYTDENKLPQKPFDLTLINTPPHSHKQLLSKVTKRGDSRIFIEKPFGGHLNYSSNENYDNVFIGYVLRFNPCVQWIKSNIAVSNIVTARGQYVSGTLEKKPKGWRNGEYSGVLNEMGSHIIDLLNYIIGMNNHKVIKSSMKSVVSDVDDIVEAELQVADKKIELFFNWVSHETRKPVFEITLELKDGSRIVFDQQIIRITKDDQLVEQITAADLKGTVPFYLRGIDFTKQMQDLIGPAENLSTMKEALTVNRIIKDILNS